MSKLTVKEAERIKSFHHWNSDLDWGYGQALAFLDYHERVQPVIEALDNLVIFTKELLAEVKVSQHYPSVERAAAVLAQYEKDLLGE